MSGWPISRVSTTAPGGHPSSLPGEPMGGTGGSPIHKPRYTLRKILGKSEGVPTAAVESSGSTVVASGVIDWSSSGRLLVSSCARQRARMCVGCVSPAQFSTIVVEFCANQSRRQRQRQRRGLRRPALRSNGGWTWDGSSLQGFSDRLKNLWRTRWPGISWSPGSFRVSLEILRTSSTPPQGAPSGVAEFLSA